MTPALLTDSIPADVRGWWASEKYDGVRAIWTGTALLTRNGKRLNAPAWFTDGLPNFRLDGELWMGRGMFDKLVSVLQQKDSAWCGVQFLVFDLAEAGSIEDRISKMATINLPDHVTAVRHVALTGHDELDRMERIIVGMGGEGVVIREPGSRYLPGRAGLTIKVKRLVADVDRWQG